MRWIIFSMASFVLCGCATSSKTVVETQDAKPIAKSPQCDMESLWVQVVERSTKVSAANLATCEAECTQGEGSSCIGAGLLLHDGVGIPKNVAKAQTLFEGQCKAGSSSGCAALGRLLVSFNNDSANVRGVSLLEDACNKDEAHACWELGLVLLRETLPPNMTKNDARLFSLHKKACDRGFATACSDTGWAYYIGRGIAKNEEIAIELYKRACDTGSLILLRDVCRSWHWSR